MGFQECNDAMGPGLFLKLEDDGDSAVVIFVAEPTPRQGSSRYGDRMQYCFPIVSEDGLQLWTRGATDYRRLRDGWKQYYKAAVKITRSGKAGDTRTRYDLKVVKMPVKLAKLRKGITSADIAGLVMDGADIPAQDDDGIPI